MFPGDLNKLFYRLSINFNKLQESLKMIKFLDLIYLIMITIVNTYIYTFPFYIKNDLENSIYRSANYAFNINLIIIYLLGVLFLKLTDDNIIKCC